MSTYQTPLIKLIGLLILLPWTVTYLHLYYYTFWQYEYCLVGHTSSSLLGHEYYDSIDNQIRSDNTQSDTLLSLASIHGMYAPIPHKKKKGDAALDRRPFRQKYSSGANLTRRTRGWPSLTHAVMMISASSSTLSKYSYIAEEQSTVLKSQHEITFVESGGTKKWCLQSGGEQWCSNPMMANASKDIIYQYPTSGTWYHSSIETRPPISISCPTPSTSTPTQKKSRHHQKQTGKQNQNLKFLLHHPSTTLLLLLNITLAYQYWNHRIPPSTVSKSYNKICIQHEWWRAFTGATAHFEPLHIGFNMMSLHTLGKELEGGFGSIVFLVYNVALVVMCTAVMMGMVYGRLCWVRYFYRGSEDVERRLIETSSVGYSGVLFALMVITTLERNQATCPIPFFSDVCFATHNVPGLPWLKFNIAPIVSLFVAQFIMPRVSFIGHLAGIACGFGLHWGWGFPPLEVCSPNVLIGAVYLVGCLLISRKVVPVEIAAAENSVSQLESGEAIESDGDDTGCVDDSVTDPFMRGKQRKKEREIEEVVRKQRTLLTIRNSIGAIALASIFLFDELNSLALSQIVLLAYFIFGTTSSTDVWTQTHINKANTEIIESGKVRAGVIWRGYVVAATLTIVLDAMSMASWVILHPLISAERYTIVGPIPATLFMIVRISVNGVGLIACSKLLYDFGQVGSGIFVQLFGWISWPKQIGDAIFLSQVPLWTAFQGRGVRLGSRPSNRTTLNGHT